MKLMSKGLLLPKQVRMDPFVCIALNGKEYRRTEGMAHRMSNIGVSDTRR